MKSFRIALFVFSVTLTAIIANSEALKAAWELCGDGEFQVDEVTLAPEEPTPGSQASFTIKAIAGAKPVTSGKIVMGVKYASLPVWTQTDDLCTKMACPLESGTSTSIAYDDVSFPPITPPGPYSVSLTGLADDTSDSAYNLPTRQLFCVAVSFEVEPSRTLFVT